MKKNATKQWKVMRFTYRIYRLFYAVSRCMERSAFFYNFDLFTTSSPLNHDKKDQNWRSSPERSRTRYRQGSRVQSHWRITSHTERTSMQPGYKCSIFLFRHRYFHDTLWGRRRNRNNDNMSWEFLFLG